MKEDLRTATFLVRQGGDQFRFAHTSLLEYFLPVYLARSLEEGRIDALDLPMPSDEALDFLGQLLAEKPDCLRWPVWKEVRSQSHPRVSELVLRYALRAGKKGHPAASLAGVQL